MLYFFIGLAFGIGVRILSDKILVEKSIDIKRILDKIFDKFKKVHKATVVSYGYNTASKILYLEYSDGHKEEYYRDFVTWRIVPSMKEVDYDKSNFINTYKVRIEFESKNTLNI